MHEENDINGFVEFTNMLISMHNIPCTNIANIDKINDPFQLTRALRLLKQVVKQLMPNKQTRQNEQ